MCYKIFLIWTLQRYCRSQFLDRYLNWYSKTGYKVELEFNWSQNCRLRVLPHFYQLEILSKWVSKLEAASALPTKLLLQPKIGYENIPGGCVIFWLKSVCMICSSLQQQFPETRDWIMTAQYVFSCFILQANAVLPIVVPNYSNPPL